MRCLSISQVDNYTTATVAIERHHCCRYSYVWERGAVGERMDKQVCVYMCMHVWGDGRRENLHCYCCAWERGAVGEGMDGQVCVCACVKEDKERRKGELLS